MIFYIRLLHSGPQVEQRNGTGKPIRAGLHRFFGICRAGGYGAQNAFQGRHTGKTGGFQRGPKPPLWHTTLLARCSVLYLPARLTGEKWRAMRFVSRLDRQKNGRFESFLIYYQAHSHIIESHLFNLIFYRHITIYSQIIRLYLIPYVYSQPSGGVSSLSYISASRVIPLI